MGDPVIKYRFIAKAPRWVDHPLRHAYEYKSPLLPVILSNLTNDPDQLFHALSLAVIEDFDGMRYTEAVLQRVESEEDKRTLFRRLAESKKCGWATLFHQAVA